MSRRRSKWAVMWTLQRPWPVQSAARTMGWLRFSGKASGSGVTLTFIGPAHCSLTLSCACSPCSAPAFPGLFRQLRDEYTQRALGEAWDGADLVQLATQLRVVVELRPVVRRKRTAALSLLTVVTAGFLLFDRFCM